MEVQFGWCSYDSSTDCEYSNVGTSDNNLNQHFSTSDWNVKYKKNSPQIRLVCLNVVQDCQVEIASNSVTCS